MTPTRFSTATAALHVLARALPPALVGLDSVFCRGRGGGGGGRRPEQQPPLFLYYAHQTAHAPLQSPRRTATGGRTKRGAMRAATRARHVLRAARLPRRHRRRVRRGAQGRDFLQQEQEQEQEQERVVVVGQHLAVVHDGQRRIASPDSSSSSSSIISGGGGAAHCRHCCCKVPSPCTTPRPTRARGATGHCGRPKAQSSKGACAA